MLRTLTACIVLVCAPALAHGQTAAQIAAGAEQSRRACQQGDALACLNLGRHHLEGGELQHNPSRALGYFRSACDLGRSEGCSNAAGMLFDEDEMNQPLRAMPLYARACELGDLRACTVAGMIYAEGNNVPQDYTRAESFFRRACDRGDVDGCRALGIMYNGGEGVVQNHRRAAEYFLRACEHSTPLSGEVGFGSGDICFSFGERFERGTGVRQDHARAAEFFTRGVRYLKHTCSAGRYENCHALGFQFESGQGVPRNYVYAYLLHSLAATRSGTYIGIEAGQARDSLAPRMTPQQISDAQAMVRRCSSIESIEDCLDLN